MTFPQNTIAAETDEICKSELVALKKVVRAEGEKGEQALPKIDQNFHQLSTCLSKVGIRLNELTKIIRENEPVGKNPFHVETSSQTVKLLNNKLTTISFSSPRGRGFEDDTFESGGVQVPSSGLYFVSFRATVDGYEYKEKGSADDTFIHVNTDQEKLLTLWKAQPLMRDSVSASGMFYITGGDNIYAQGVLRSTKDAARNSTSIKNATLVVTKIQ